MLVIGMIDWLGNEFNSSVERVGANNILNDTLLRCCREGGSPTTILNKIKSEAIDRTLTSIDNHDFHSRRGLQRIDLQSSSDDRLAVRRLFDNYVKDRVDSNCADYNNELDKKYGIADEGLLP